MSLYLVTGGAGFIGSHCVDALLASGHSVRVLDDLSTGKMENLRPECEFVHGDIRDAGVVATCLHGVDACIHLAAVASVQRSVDALTETHQINLAGTVQVFELASKINVPVIYASSAAVYGDSEDLPLSELISCVPQTPYGVDKLAAESHARVAHNISGLNSVGLRFFNVYGPRQDPKSPYSGVISIFAERVIQGLPVIVHGDGEQTRDFIYVVDVVEYILSALDFLEATRAAAVFNVCSGKVISVNELIDTLVKITGNGVGREYVGARSGDIRHSLGSPDNAIRQLKVTSANTLEEGLTKTLASDDFVKLVV